MNVYFDNAATTSIRKEVIDKMSFVSETKKKYVASSQGWKCATCGVQLPGSFEVDHIIRLEHGGTNEINNLRAQCRNCHGEKTAMENL